jgi:hypothetical protein
MISFQQKLLFEYPTLRTNKDIGYSAMVISISVYFFLAVFQPFGTYTFHHSYKYLLLLPYTVIAFLFFFSANFLTHKLFVNWNLKKEIYKNLIVLLGCSLANYFYLISIVDPSPFSIINLLYMVLFTFLLGVPICTLNVFAKYVFIKNSNVQGIKDQEKLKTEDHIPYSLHIYPDSGEQLSIPKKGFYYAKSEGNYSLLYYLRNGKVQQKLVRLSLKRLEKQIGDETIFRCHRSYVLNSKHILSGEGNSQGYKMSLENITDKIPVSRSYVERVKRCSV